LVSIRESTTVTENAETALSAKEGVKAYETIEIFSFASSWLFDNEHMPRTQAVEMRIES
jgi:hypothetical protein